MGSVHIGPAGVLDAGHAAHGHHGHGPIAGRDARARVVLAGAFAVVVVALSQLGTLLLALAWAFATLVLARLPVGQTLRRVVAMDTFIVFMIALLPFTVPGEPMVEVMGLPASREGLVQAATIALKANAAVMMAMALLASLEPVALARALARLKMPEALVHLVLFTVRYIDVLEQEYRRLRTAMRARAFRPANSRHTYVSFGYLVGMMLVRALERSERILQAMKCRGFAGRLYLGAEGRFTSADALFCATWAVFMLGLTLLEIADAAAL